MRSILLTISIFTFVLSLNACKTEHIGYSGLGKVPIYLPLAALDDIGSQAPQAVEQSGPIYLIGDFFFMIENRKGIHVYDISDDEQENSLVFIKIPAVTDFTIDGNFLYADSWRDLVTIDISDIYNVVLVSRIEDVFDPFLYPQLYNGPFECVDESQGAVVGWENQELENVYCRTIN